MNAMYLSQKAGPESLIWGELDRPQPQAGEVLVAVHAAAATPTEFDWFPTFHTRKGDPRPFPIVPGHELSGVVAALGAGVTSLKPGDAVFGMNDWFANGALAEFVVAPASALAPKPVSLTHVQAATVPISALTAWQALTGRGRVQAGQRVLVHGAAGGVGQFAVQLARRNRAQVFATASAGNLDFVRQLGADQVIDYRATRFEEVARDIDLVIDPVGGDTLARSWNVLRPGGKIVTVASTSATAPNARDRDAFMLVEVNRAQLAGVARLLDTGELGAWVAAEFSLRDAREAFALAQRGKMRGKVVLRVSA